jgi:site-specific recombinase XerD
MREELGSDKVRQALREGRKLPFRLQFADVLACMNAAATERDGMIVRLLYASGVRRAELAQLIVEDLDLTEGGVFVRDGKYGKDRYICIDRTTQEMLRDYTRYMKRDARLFGVSDKQIARIVVKCGEKAGIGARYDHVGRHFGPHAFRHLYATRVFEHGMDPYDLQWLMGHDHVETTRIYVHLNLAHVRQIYDRTHDFALLAAAGTPAPLAAAVQIVQTPQPPPRYDRVRTIADQLFEATAEVQGSD